MDMKYKIVVLLLVPFGMFNCSSEESGVEENETVEEVVVVDENGDDTEDDDTEETLITYSANVATIISTNCLECHGAQTENGAPNSLHTYQLLSDAAEIVDYRMNSENNNMPPDSRGGLIAQADRDIIKQWIVDGLLEN